MSAEDVAITEADESDIEAISSFFWEAWHQAGPGSPGFAGATEDVISEIADPRMIRSRIGGPDRRMYIARVGDRVVGFASTKVQDRATVELSGVVVLEDMSGGGVGSLLVEAAIDASRTERFDTMTVTTETSNDRALTFYKRHGFAVIGTSTETVEQAAVEVFTLSLALQPR